MKSVKKRTLWALLVLSVALVLWPGVTAAQQLTMYELTEQVKFGPNGELVLSMIRTAALQGTADPGSPVCPFPAPCALTATAVATVNLATGTGPVLGDYAVVVQDPNVVDGPEIVVQIGTFDGTVDLTLAASGIPLALISGTFSPMGGTPSAFTGKFRLPFTKTAGGKHVGPKRGQNAFYLKDDGKLEKVQIDELSIGYPTVRLEVTFQ